MKSLSSVAAAAVLLAPFGCPSPALTEQLHQSTTASDSQVAFNAASGAFQQSHWSDAEEKFADFLVRFPLSPLAVDARYRRAVCLNRLGKFMEARQTLREFLDRYPTSEDQPQAAQELAYAEAMAAHIGKAPPVPAVSALPGVATSGTPGPANGPSATLDLIRQTARQAKAGDTAAMARLEALVDVQATFIDITTLYGEADEGSAAWPYVAAKMARIFFHIGDIDRAKEAAIRAMRVGAAGHPDRMQQILDVAALREDVKPSLIGVVLPLSGKLKPYGEAVETGIEMAIPKGNGLFLSVKDSEGDRDKAVAAVDALAKEGVIAIIGPVGPLESAPASLRAQELGIPIISLSRAEGLTDIGPYVFRNSITNSAQGKALARYAAEVLNTKEAGILAPDVPMGKEVTNAFWHTFQGEGGEIKGYESFPIDETTFKTTVQRLIPHAGTVDHALIEHIKETEHNAFRLKKKLAKLKGGGGRPVVDFDVLLIPAFDYRSVLQIAPALKVEDVVTDPCVTHHGKTANLSRPVTLLGTAGWDDPALLSRDARDVQCAVIVDGFYADSSREPTQKFVNDFRDQFKHDPVLLHALGYDTASIVKQVLTNAHAVTRDAFRQALGEVRSFPGATGETSFGPDREADKPLFFLTVERTGFTELPVNISPAGIAAPPKSAQQ